MPQPMVLASQLALHFLRVNECPPKPRAHAVTEIPGPRYSVMGPRCLTDVLDTMGEHVDALRFAGDSFVQLECWGTKDLSGRVVTYPSG